MDNFGSASRKYNHALFANMAHCTDAVWELDIKGNTVFIMHDRFTPEASQKSCSFEQMHEKLYRETHPDYRDSVCFMFRPEYIRNLCDSVSFKTLMMVDGSYHTLKCVMTPLFDTSGKVIAAYVSAQDIQNILDESNAAPPTTGPEIHDALTTVNHDFRTSMNSIVGYTDLIRTHLDDRERVLDYLSKISEASGHLLKLIDGELNGESEEPAENTAEKEEKIPRFTATNAGDLHNCYVLLAEDNFLNREIATVLLEDAGAVVDIAENGLEAVEKVTACTGRLYDLILMDIQMPLMNGYQAAQEIRNMSDAAKASIPIIAMTASAFHEDRIRAIESGMNAHIAKPIQIDAVFETIADTLSQR